MPRRLHLARAVFLGIAVAAAVLGWVGIREHILSEQGDASTANIAYGVITLFVAPSLRSTGEISLALRVAQVAALAATGFVAFDLFRSTLQVRYRQLRMARRTGHVAVVGIGEIGALLASQLAETGEPVVAGIDAAPSQRAKDLFDRPRWALFAGDATNPAVLERSSIADARTVYVATGHDGTDVSVTRQLRTLMVRKTSTAHRRIRVQIDSPDLCRRLEQEELADPAVSPVEVEYINHLQLTASAVLEYVSEHLARECGVGPHETLADRLVLVGTSRLLREIRSLVGSGHRARTLMGVATTFAVEPTAVLLDPPSAAEPATADGPSVPGVMIVQTDDPQETIAMAVDASQTHPGYHVFALTPMAGPPIATTARGDVGPVIITDPERLVQSPAVLSAGTIELMARLIHLDYLSSQGVADDSPPDPAAPARRPWAALADSFREANRDQARDVGRKVEAIGCRLSETRRDPAVLTDDEIEQLARMEHERWSDERQRAGWTWAETRDDEARTHPDLREYDELSEEAKEKDRQAVRRMHVLAALLGLVIVRRRDPGTTDAASA